MTEGETQDRLARILEQALDLPDAQRHAFVARACGNDREQREEIVDLLSREEEADALLGVGRKGVTVLSHGTTAAIMGGGPTAATMERSAGAPPAPTTAARPPADDAKYTVQREIARGGMGVILRVTDKSLSRELAMKKILGLDIPPDKLTSLDRERLARFLEEAHITAQLDHPGILPVHELGVDANNSAFFTMALVRGRHFGEIIALVDQQGGGWTLTRAIGVVIKACQAMAYAHQKRVVHRDLKPANVMVGEFGEVYVLDWGLAKLLDADDANERHHALVASMHSSPPVSTPRRTSSTAGGNDPLRTNAGSIIGTPSYMSPEQADGQIDAVRELSDIYSLGAILYELLTKSAPYTRPKIPDSPYEILESIAEGTPAPIHSLRPDAPPELIAICEKAMATVPSNRYASALEMASDLEAYLDQRVVKAFETGAFAEFKKWVVRHRQLLVSVGVASVLIAGLAIGFNWRWKQQQARKLVTEAQSRFERYGAIKQEIAEAKPEWEDAMQSQPRWAPVWRRGDELAAHDRLRSLTEELDQTSVDGILGFTSARSVAPWLSSVRRHAAEGLEKFYWSRYQEAMYEGGLLRSPELFRQLVHSVDLGNYRDELDGSGVIRIASTPPGATVYCFRYVEVEKRRLPIPFDFSRSVAVGDPELLVAAIDNVRLAPSFRTDDRLISVAGKAVPTRGALASALSGLKIDESVVVNVKRGATSTSFEWTPFPEWFYADSPEQLTAGKLVHLQDQLGLRFQGYPLQFVDAAIAGKTPEVGSLEIPLPLGSYLIILKAGGRKDARVPVVMPWRRGTDLQSIRSSALLDVGVIPLLTADEMPPNFVYIPPGPYSLGGDPAAFQSQKREEGSLPAYFVSRFEVTMEEYLRFLNAGGITPLISENGFINRNDLTSEKSRRLLEAHGRPSVRLVPALSRSGDLVCALNGNRWEIASRWKKSVHTTSPAVGVTQIAAIEYAEWRTRESGGRWRYRLPSDKEWEKAARGVDRRTFVWGDYFLWTYSWSGDYRYDKNRLPPVVGLVPMDESIYGVRDLSGSVDEYTTGHPSRRSFDVSRRGGNWKAYDEYFFRTANRNSFQATGCGTSTGFRLLAESPAQE